MFFSTFSSSIFHFFRTNVFKLDFNPNVTLSSMTQSNFKATYDVAPDIASRTKEGSVAPFAAVGMFGGDKNDPNLGL